MVIFLLKPMNRNANFTKNCLQAIFNVSDVKSHQLSQKAIKKNGGGPRVQISNFQQSMYNSTTFHA